MCVSLQHSILPRQEQETQQSQEARCNSASVFFFPLFFHCCHAVCCCCCVPVPHRRLLTFPQLWYNSSRTTRSSFCDSYERCFCVCVCARTILNTKRGYSNLHLLRISKAPTQCSYGTTPANLLSLIHTGTPVFPLFRLRHCRDFKPTTSRRGTLYVCYIGLVAVGWQRPCINMPNTA